MCAVGSGRLFLAVAFAAAMSWATASRAQTAVTMPVPRLDFLDGQSFVGEMGLTGKSSGRPDEFIFADEKLYSKVCLDGSFSPEPYWMRLESGRVHFLARLTRPENGVMTYEGTVDGPQMDVRIGWIKPRWYWTMEKTLWFRGIRNASTAEGGN